MTISQKREEFGIELKFAGGKQAEEHWDQGHEMNFYDHAHARGWSADLVQSMVTDYIQAGEGAMYASIPDEALDQLAAKYVKAGKISTEDAALLRRWIREEVEGGAS